MTIGRRTSLAAAIACAAVLCAAVVAAARSAGSLSVVARAQPAVGTLALVQGRILDLHAGAKRAVLVKNGARVLADDVLTPARGASARILFTGAAKHRTGTLFTLRALRAATQRIQAGAASLGPRIAFGYDGSSIATVAGKGLDATARVKITRAGSRRVRLGLSAPGSLNPTFACAIDRRGFAPCLNAQIVRLAAGRHTVTVRTTSLFGFHGPSAVRRFLVVG